MKEEIEIIVTARVEEVIKQFRKVVPEIKKVAEEAQRNFAQIDTKQMTNRIQQAVQSVRKSIDDLKKSNKDSQIKLNINSQDAQKQVSQLQKEIDSLQRKINSRQLKLDINNETLEKMKNDTKQQVKEEMPGGKKKEIQKETNLRLNTDKNYTSLITDGKKLNNEITKYSSLLETAKEGMASLDIQSSKTGNGQAQFEELGGMLKQSLEMINPIIDQIESSKGLVTNLFGENAGEIIDTITQALTGVTIAIQAVSIAIDIYNFATTIAEAVTTTFNISLLPIILGVMAIVAVIILCITYWDEICAVVSIVVSAIVEYITNLWSQVSFIFEAIWEVISTILGFIWNIVKTVFEGIWNIISPIINAIWQVISTIFEAIWNIISTILGSIWNIFSQVFNWVWQLVSKVFQGIWNIISPIITKVWENIKFTLGKIQEVWSKVWNIISSVVNKVWNGIWTGIKFVINLILGGIEGFVNGTIKGINILLRGISSVANAIGSLIGLDPINLQISMISLPRLSKGGVLTKATAVLVGEYAGARNNPEIVTPQNIMEETFERVMSKYQNHNESKPIRVQIAVGGKNLVDELIEGINDKTRQTGKAQIRVGYA